METPHRGQLELKPAPIADAVVLKTTANALNTTVPTEVDLDDVEQGKPDPLLALASAIKAPVQTARPVSALVRQFSDLTNTAAADDPAVRVNATKPKLSQTVMGMLIPILFIVYAIEYGDSWGKGSTKAEDAKCASGFPEWMLVIISAVSLRNAQASSNFARSCVLAFP
jgi:hypothetical protein